MFLGVEELFSLSSKGYVYYSHLRSTALGGGKYGWEGRLHHIRHLTAKELVYYTGSGERLKVVE